MKRLLFIPSIVAVSAAVHASSGDLKSYLIKLNPAVAKAYKTKDTGFFDKLFSPLFKEKDEHGVVQGRKEALFVLRFQLNTMHVTDYQAKMQSLKMANGCGIVTTRSKMLGIKPSRRGGPAEKVEIDRQWQDTYKKQGTAWVLIYRAELVTPMVKLTPIPATPLTPAKKH